MLAVYFYDPPLRKITLTKYIIINYITLLKEHLLIIIALKTIIHICTKPRIDIGIKYMLKVASQIHGGKDGLSEESF